MSDTNSSPEDGGCWLELLGREQRTSTRT